MDGKGNMSMTRLIAFMLCLGGLIMAFIYPDYEVGYLGIITAGLGGKITQKKLSEDGKETNILTPDVSND